MFHVTQIDDEYVVTEELDRYSLDKERGMLTNLAISREAFDEAKYRCIFGSYNTFLMECFHVQQSLNKRAILKCQTDNLEKYFEGDK